ncbi:MAG: hypothetical protein Q9227_003496 [Pyrenula ochraceoflavens]
MEDLSSDEVKGRWKSFVGKWNRGELAEGWYDPKTLQRALDEPPSQSRPSPPKRTSSQERTASRQKPKHEGPSSNEDEDDYGPPVPHHQTHPSSHLHGPKPANTQDLLLKREADQEAAAAAHSAHTSSHREARRLDRKSQKEALDDLVPRAEPGTRERQLEKKREKAESHRSFAQARDRSPEFRDEDVMGGEDGGLAELKRMKEREERRKNEREVRREEMLKARAAEREERWAEIRTREERTMDMLRGLAKARWGEGGG